MVKRILCSGEIVRQAEPKALFVAMTIIFSWNAVPVGSSYITVSVAHLIFFE